MSFRGIAMRLLGFSTSTVSIDNDQDRKIKVLSARLGQEAAGLRRAKIELRSALMQEILEPGPPHNDVH